MRVLSGSVAVLLLSLSVFGQPSSPASPAPQSPHGFNRLAQNLSLTADQQTQIQALLQSERTQQQAIRTDASLSPQQKHDKLRDLRESTHSQMMSLLTPEQQQKMKQTQPDSTHVSGVGPLDQLGLTPEQKQKIQPILQSSNQQMKALRADASLTPEQRQTKSLAIRQSTNSQIDAVLTPGQRQQLRQYRQHEQPQTGSSSLATTPQGL